MRAYEPCRPCFVRQALRAAESGGANAEQLEMIRERVETYTQSMNIETASPAALASYVYRTVREITGIEDPYAQIKRECNAHALDLYETVLAHAPAGMPPLERAVHLAIIGNIIDFGTEIHIDLDGTAQRAFAAPFAVDEIDLLRERIHGARCVLYLADNAGEIVFDRELLAILGGEGRELVMAVKGGPSINDAMLEDAETAGLSAYGWVIENGTDAVGTQLDSCSPEFMREWNRADLIISKGQANAESLLGLNDERIFFLYLVKCAVMGDYLGLRFLDFIAGTAPTLLRLSEEPQQ